MTGTGDQAAGQQQNGNNAAQPEKPSRGDYVLRFVLVIYLLAMAGVAVGFIVLHFPTFDKDKHAWIFPTLRYLDNDDQKLLFFAILAGVAGSFIHAGQSFATYIGNEQFRRRWCPWYFLRPWIGGVLGLSIYVVLRVGLVSGFSEVNPYGVVAIALLAGWFSKTTSDKLQEVFETLFPSKQDEKRKDKLIAFEQPVITSIEPSPVPNGVMDITIKGKNFQNGAVVKIGSVAAELAATFVSDTQLRVSLTPLGNNRPAAGTMVPVRVKNKEGPQPESPGHDLTFQ